MPDDRIVRVKVPAATLYDIDKMVQIQKRILGELGCAACCSGHDIRYEVERHFTVDAKLNVKVNKISE
jgi:hypothetical protein